jgi:hypothetical protein
MTITLTSIVIGFVAAIHLLRQIGRPIPKREAGNFGTLLTNIPGKLAASATALVRDA